MNLRFIEEGGRESLESFAWDDDLNAGLIQLGVRCADADQESERIALTLRAALRPAEREFGDGYLNGVLADLVRDSDLVRFPEIEDVLKHAYVLSPERNGRAASRYNQCREMIADAISRGAHDLRDSLRYPEDEAKGILVKALARYLDERYSVSSRRQLGLL